MTRTTLTLVLFSLSCFGMFGQALDQPKVGTSPALLGPPGDPVGGTPAERAALKKVVLHNFTVSPLSVAPFGTVTASWNVTVPATGFVITIELNGQPVPTAGSKTFAVTQQTVFTLNAVILDDNATRSLRQWTVHLNTSECHVLNLPSTVISQPLKERFDSIFSGTSKYQLKPGGTTVTAGLDKLNINVPLSIEVPDWFDADMEVAIQLSIAGSSQIFVGDPVVNANVHWSPLSNILSFGCTDAIGDGMTQMAQVFLEQIVNAQLIPSISQELIDSVKSYTDSLTAADPAHRKFVLTSLIYSGTSGLTITACPQ